MEIEDSIDKQDRIKQGIFFTKIHIVEEIVSCFDFKNIKTVVDSAAGSCNFLIPLAIKYPNIEFYGVEKNEVIFNSVLDKISNINNIHYFLGDILTDSFPIPKCDLYLGNPPFINFSDLDQNYRELIKPIWLSFFTRSTGFKMLLGDSRGDISQLIFALTIKKYLKNKGQFGVVLPNSLIKGNSASAGFREFNSISVDYLVDISDTNAFDNTSRNCFYIVGKSGGITNFPIKYITKDKTINLGKSGDDLIEIGKSILKESYYKARQGINTLGANSVFFFKGEISFESELLKPLLKSSDIEPFSYSPSYKVIFPYINGKVIPEDILRKDYPQGYKYLVKHREKLEGRKSRFAQKCWYSLFGVGPYTCSKYKVVWRGLGAKKLMVAVTENVIPNQSMNCYISTESSSEAHFICGIMNSELYRSQLIILNESGAKSFAQPNTINKIFMPKFNLESDLHLKISNISLDLHKNYDENNYKKLEKIVKKLYISEGFF